VFGRLAFPFARWKGAVGLIGGVAGLLTLVVYEAGLLALIQLASFTILAFATEPVPRQ
jgi:hypothetical protein